MFYLKRSIIIVCLIVIVLLINYKVSNTSKNQVSSTLEYDSYVKEDYYGYIRIPSVDMNLGFYEYDNPLNDVDLNVLWVKIPVKDSYFFAAHSGVGSTAYFNPLRNVSLNDDIYLELDGNTIHYKISNIYRTVKDGNVNISNIEGMIYLTTCDQVIDGYQLVIEGIKM